MKKFFNFIITFVFVIYVGFFVYLFTYSKTDNFKPNVVLNNKKIYLEIADTQEKQYNGLSFNKKLCSNCGMLFIFNNDSKKAFVMRNMNFSLDIIFIGKDNKIIKIYKNLKPEGNKPKNIYESYGKYVLEVNGGFSDKYKLNIGEKVYLNLTNK